MNTDEQGIRDFVDEWWEAARNNDVDGALELIADDAVFMVAGEEPFGKKEFEDQSRRMKDVHMEGSTEVLESAVLGDTAWFRGRLTFRMDPPGGRGKEINGYLLQILRKRTDGGWMIFREANLLPTFDMPGDQPTKARERIEHTRH